MFIACKIGVSHFHFQTNKLLAPSKLCSFTWFYSSCKIFEKYRKFLDFFRKFRKIWIFQKLKENLDRNNFIIVAEFIEDIKNWKNSKKFLKKFSKILKNFSKFIQNIRKFCQKIILAWRRWRNNRLGRAWRSWKSVRNRRNPKTRNKNSSIAWLGSQHFHCLFFFKKAFHARSNEGSRGKSKMIPAHKMATCGWSKLLNWTCFLY